MESLPALFSPDRSDYRRAGRSVPPVKRQVRHAARVRHQQPIPWRVPRAESFPTSPLSEPDRLQKRRSNTPPSTRERAMQRASERSYCSGASVALPSAVPPAEKAAGRLVSCRSERLATARCKGGAMGDQMDVACIAPCAAQGGQPAFCSSRRKCCCSERARCWDGQHGPHGRRAAAEARSRSEGAQARDEGVASSDP